MRVNLVIAVSAFSASGLAVLALAGSGPAAVAAVDRPAATATVRAGQVAAYPGSGIGFPGGITAAAPGSACHGWAGASPPKGTLQGAAVISACDAWAVGGSIFHWNGSTWTVVASPAPGPADVSGIQAASRTDIWAVGCYMDSGGAEFTLALHWNGTAWTQVATPSPGGATNDLVAVRVLSANDAWAVGNSYDGVEVNSLILHWNGAQWTGVASPSPARFTQLASVAATSSTNAWAVGDAFDDGADVDAALIVHWNGAQWTQVATPSLGTSAALSGVSAKSASNAWAVGGYYNGLAAQTLILHWNGTKWTQVASPDPGGFAHDNFLSSVVVQSADNAWAVGSYTSGPAGTKTLLLHWDGLKWTQVASPSPGTSNQLNAVRVGPAGSAWAVGVSDSTALAITAAAPSTRTGLAGQRR